MTKEQLAQSLNGRQYGNEITKEEKQSAKESGLVVVFGASDDLMEFEGAISEELGAYNGAEALIFKNVDKRWDVRLDEELNEIRELMMDKRLPFNLTAYKVESKWCPDDFEGSWLMATTLPHAMFDIMEDEQLYCRGVVIDLNELTA